MITAGGSNLCELGEGEPRPAAHLQMQCTLLSFSHTGEEYKHYSYGQLVQTEMRKTVYWDSGAHQLSDLGLERVLAQRPHRVSHLGAATLTFC